MALAFVAKRAARRAAARNPSGLEVAEWPSIGEAIRTNAVIMRTRACIGRGIVGVQTRCSRCGRGSSRQSGRVHRSRRRLAWAIPSSSPCPGPSRSAPRSDAMRDCGRFDLGERASRDRRPPDATFGPARCQLCPACSTTSRRRDTCSAYRSVDAHATVLPRPSSRGRAIATTVCGLLLVAGRDRSSRSRKT